MEKRNEELERAIFANPDDVAAYSVYADWLQAQGEPRGELIALQLAGKSASAAALIESQAEYFLGSLAEHRYTRELPPVETFTWRNGFIHGARLSCDQNAVPGPNLLAWLLGHLLAHPSGRFLAELAFGFNGDPNEDSLQSLVDVLAREPRPTLRKVHFGQYKFAGGHAAGLGGEDTEISWYSVGSLGDVWPKLPALETLIVQGASAASAIAGGTQLGTLVLPSLRHLEVRSGGLDVENVRAVMTADIPEVEHLEIWFGSPEYGGDATIDDVELLLARTDLPHLRRLGLRNAMFSDALPEVLARSALLPQLTALDVSLGALTDEGARAFAASKAAFAHLETLDVSQCYLTDEGTELLRDVAKTLVVGEQRDDEDPEYRYPAIAE